RPPYAYFILQKQRDPVAPVELLRRLAFNGVRIDQLTTEVSFEGIRYPAGTWVIPMNQEFAEMARQVLDPQTYPDLREFPEGPPEQPYDASGWTLPYQMDVAVVAASTPLTDEVRAALRPVQGTAADWTTVDETAPEPDASAFDSVPGLGFDTHPIASGIVPAAGLVTGSGPSLALDPAQNNAFNALNRAWKAGGAVHFEPGSAGTSARYVISGVGQAAQDQWVEDLALQAERVRSASGPRVASRIGLYRPWRASMDEGWTRWLLERYGFTFTNLTNADFHAGALRERFDVIVLPAESPRALLAGYTKGSVPPRYEGGIGAIGVRALDAFVRKGGTLVCLNQSSTFAIEHLHLPVRNVVGDLDRKDFFASGSILEVTTDPSHPVMAGMPVTAKVFVSRSPVFTTKEGFKGAALATYQKAGSPLLSGYLLGAEHLQGYAAALDVHHGDGHVLLLGFRPQWRGQSFGTFRVLFNAVLYGGALAAQHHGTPGFWLAPPEAKEKTKEESGN
ncbi:MAG: hypothetical protein ACE10K_00080, partial [Rhodothermales bacterium]